MHPTESLGQGLDGPGLSGIGILGPRMGYGLGAQMWLLRAINICWCPQGPDNVDQFLKMNNAIEKWKKQNAVSKRKALNVGSHLDRNFSLSLKPLPVLFPNQSLKIKF